MLRQEIEEQLAERLVQRIEEANVSILKKIGETIKRMSTMNTSQARQLSQMIRFGGDYRAIASELAKVSGKNVQEIYTIFAEIAKSDKEFAKKFYKYRNLKYIPYEKDIEFQAHVRSIANLTANTYLNISNTSAVGYIFEDKKGNKIFKNIEQTYQEVIDRGILSISQGKESFDTVMRDTIKQIGGSGLVQYESGRTRRVDSAVRMNLLDGMRQLTNEDNKRFGEEYGADGVEISVHANPAPDHADIQGRQFSNEEYKKLQDGMVAEDYKGILYDGSDKRHISEYNCYHKEFHIVLGVSKPLYSDEELSKIKKENEKGFDFDGKHYTMYEGTQLQRRLELEARKQKDIQILAKASDKMDVAKEAQRNIQMITNKYMDLCNKSGLKPKMKRMSVPGYRKIAI